MIDTTALRNAIAEQQTEGLDRAGMSPLAALIECNDLWGSGAWDDRNAVLDLAEVMGYIDRLVKRPGDPASEGGY